MYNNLQTHTEDSNTELGLCSLDKFMCDKVYMYIHVHSLRLLASNSHTHFTTGSGASIDSSQEGAPPSDPTENLVPSTPQEGTLNETGCVEDLEDMYIIVQDFEVL